MKMIKKSPFERFPLEFRERLFAALPDKAHKILNVFTEKRHTTIRVNTLKTNTSLLTERLEHEGIRLKPVNWNKNAFIVINDLRELQETSSYKEGLLYVQSLSSQIPPLVLNPKKGSKVLDICAAPGSKTSQMAALMENTGEILANDVSQVRLLKLKANLNTLGVTNTLTSYFHAESIWNRFKEYFDYTLVDVPCSGEGRFYMYEPKTFSEWSVKNIDRLSKQAKWIMRSAISATAVGGTLVYSTCTLSPEENEEVIDWILEKEKENIVIETFRIPGLVTYPALRSWKDKIYHPDVANTVRILPSDTMEGFFVAKIKKVQSNIGSSSLIE